MDTPNPSADEGGGGAGAARPENSSGSGGFAPSAPPEISRPLAFRLSEASKGNLVSSPQRSTDWLSEDEDEGGPLLEAGTDGLRAPPVSDTTTTPTALEESTLRLASGLEHMNLTGREPPAVERPSVSTMKARKRTPGRWRRIPRPNRETHLWRPRPHSAEVKAMVDKWDLSTRENIEEFKNMREQDCDLKTEQDKLDFHAYRTKMIASLQRIVDSTPENTFFTYTRCTDTKEEHLTAEGMEAQILAQFPGRQPCQQAKYFAELALEHYNEKKKHKFQLATTLLSNCFSESSGTTYGHVNFTGLLQENTGTQSTSSTKRLFFAELMLIPELQAKSESRPMRVVHVYMLDESPCYGGCHEIFRKIDHKMRHGMDYERCHACSDRIKHPKGQLFDGGHNSSRMPYYSAI